MQPSHPSTKATPDTTSRRDRLLRWLLWVIAGWAVIAYLIAPQVWKLFYGHRGNEFAQVERLSQTSDHHPGDPLNIVLVGDEVQLVRAMAASGWYPADPITLASSQKIAADSVLRRPDDQAPVSNLFLFGRRQDLAFEQPVPGGPSHRHHVRFWKWDQTDEGRPAWFGAATYDERVGLSYTTGQVTHHIGPDIDAERDRIVAQLRSVGVAEAAEWRDNFHQQRQGRNGGGDPWHTDGRLAIVLLDRAAGAAR